MHNEITCPYCRIQFGNYKISKENKVEHIDIFWSSECGLIRECQQSEIVLANMESVDEYGNPKFTESFQTKLTELRNKFENKPDDISKENTTFDDYMVAFIECMNYGYVDGDDEEYDKEDITKPKIQQIYEDGVNLYEALRIFIKESK
jgi:hypothetical protein